MSSEELQAQIPAWNDGVLTPMGKLLVHQLGLRHKAVSIFILSGAHILLQRRAMEKYHTPGLWANTCCTHPHWQEADRDCAQRRLREELGITGVDLSPKGQICYEADVGKGLIENEVVEVFVGHVLARPSLAPDPTEVMDTQWMTLDELRAQTLQNPEKFTPWLRIYMADHLAQILEG